MLKKMIYAFFVIACCLQFSARAEHVQALSFDGGGVRGVVSLELLKNLQQDAQFNYKNFDIYAGTSTGSILALCCACGMEIDEIISDYEDMSRSVFSNGHFFSFLYEKYSADELKKKILHVLKKNGYSEDTLIKDLPKKIVITTVKLDDKESGRWTLEFIENITEGGGNVKVIDAILDSTAAPMFFPSHQNHVDGGMGMNDPCLAALTYALELSDYDLKDIVILSIGTGYENRYIKDNEDWGFFQWFIKSPDASAGSAPLTVMIMDVEQQMTAQITSKMLGDSFKKIDFLLKEAIALDDYEKIDTLIEFTKDFIQNNPDEWKEICRWVEDYLKN